MVCSAWPVQTSPLAARFRISKDGYFAALCWSWNWLFAPTRKRSTFGSGFLLGCEERSVVLLEVGGGGGGVGVGGGVAVDVAVDGDYVGYVGYSGGDVAFGVGLDSGRDGSEVVGVEVGDHADVDCRP